MAHPASLSLFDVLDAADALSQGTFLPVVVTVVAGIVVAFGVVAHERKRAKTDRRSRNVRARAEQESLAGAARQELHLDEREERDLHPPKRLERVLREALHGEVCDVFPEEGGRD